MISGVIAKQCTKNWADGQPKYIMPLPTAIADSKA